MKLGRKGKADAKNRRELKAEFDRRGIRNCEHCGTGFGLTFAHSLKRKDIKTAEQMKECALLCLPEHMRIEQLPPAEMAKEVRAYIAKREFSFA